MIVTAKTSWNPPARRWRAEFVDGRGRALVEGFGPTAKAAKADLDRAVGRFLATAGEEPLIVRGTDVLGAIVYAQDGEWRYRLVEGLLSRSACGGWDSRLEAEVHARRHLAQSVFDPATPDGPSGMDVLHHNDREGRYEHARWLTWQRAYAAAKARGLGDAACREEANKL